MSKSKEDTLEFAITYALGLTTAELIKKLKSGEASSQDMKLVLQLAKDNGVTLLDMKEKTDPTFILDAIDYTLPFDSLTELENELPRLEERYKA